jgi:hypothetical protein
VSIVEFAVSTGIHMISLLSNGKMLCWINISLWA